MSGSRFAYSRRGAAVEGNVREWKGAAVVLHSWPRRSVLRMRGGRPIGSGDDNICLFLVVEISTHIKNVKYRKNINYII